MILLREKCGISISELQKESLVSRTTIYAFERGENIKRETKIKILRALGRHTKAAAMRADVNLALRELGVDSGGGRSVEGIISDLRGIKNELMQFSGPEGDYDPDYSILSQREILALTASVKALSAEIQTITFAHKRSVVSIDPS